MRAVRLVELRNNSVWFSWLVGPVRERLVGYHAVCASCGTAVRADVFGMRPLRTISVTPQADEREQQRKERLPELDVNRTPGMTWTREAR
jgi:hypothetical protein